MRRAVLVALTLAVPRIADAQAEPAPTPLKESTANPPAATLVAVTAEAELDPVTVTASKAERRASELPATVTVIDAERLQREVIENLRDLVRYEPGVTVPHQGSRFGNAGINIRGLGANRVQIEIDGIAVSDSFSIGSFSNAGRDFVDLDNIKRVEIVRGPASSIYGSDALGGVVAFTTKDPLDFLGRGASGFGGVGRLGYFSADETKTASGTAAYLRGDWSGLINVVRREGHELDNAGVVGGAGAARTKPNPHDYTGTDVLAKLLWNEASGSPVRLTIENFDNDSDTDSLSSVAATVAGPTTTATTSLTADDEARRSRISLDQTLHSLLGFDGISWRAYGQESRTRQDTLEGRRISNATTGAVSIRERQRRFVFEQQVVGGEATVTRNFSTGALKHKAIAGLEIETTETRQSRDGLERNLTAGTQTTIVGPDAFPVRDFPITDTLKGGLYLQDDISWGRFTLVPGVRVDRYELDPKPDDIFTADNPGVVSSGLNRTQVSPKVGLLVTLTEQLSAYAQYAEGFRAPPFSDVNIGFTNVQFGYTAIANPDLKPETSEGVELGLRANGKDHSGSVAVYRNRYDDFINSLVALGVDPTSGLLVFQSQNVAKARIEGVEFKGDLRLRALSPLLREFRLRSSIAYARGDDQTARRPINTVEPLTGLLGLSWEPEAVPLSLELVVTATDGKARVDESAGPQFRSPGQVRVDFLAQWSPLHNVDLNVGLFNLTDRRLFSWSDVQGRPANDPAIDRFSQPGINVAANLRVCF